MNYLVLFEAFESQILSKTLSYFKIGKDKFLRDLKNICSDIDFPFSNLNDDFFEYLPFKKALEKNISVSDTPCDAKSSVFGEFEVPGEVCSGGKIKRKWGSRTRLVDCPVCNGSGVKKNESEVKLIKFWFDVNGNYLCKSAVDGVIRSTISSSDIKDFYDISVEKTFSTYDELLSGGVSTGDYLMGKIGRKRELRTTKDIIFYILKKKNDWGRDIFYCLSDDPTCNGSEPNVRWRNTDTIFGNPKYSWGISYGGDFNGELKLLKIESKGSDVYDPYRHNVYMDRGIDASVNLKEKIKKASFSLILDLGKLKSSKYDTVSDLKAKRQISKEGAFLTDDEIKKANIKRYLEKLKDVDVSEISNFNLLLKRIFGFNRNNYIYILSENDSNITNAIGNMRSYYTSIIDSISRGDIESAKEQVKEINSRIKSYSTWALEKSSNVSNNITRLKSELEDSNLILDKMDEINKELVKQIDKFNFECPEDFNIFINKLNYFRSVIRDSMASSSYRSFLNYSATSDYKKFNLYFDDCFDLLKNNINKFDSIKTTIKRY